MNNMIEVSLSEQIAEACPELYVLTIQCEIENTVSNDNLWKQISLLEEEVRNSYRMEDINKRPAIRANRQAYKKLGKDPNRYRPSAESLCRRIVRGLPLYKIDTLVDIVNFISIESGYSIGAFDVDKIKGDHLILGVGTEDEIYTGIGRGLLNIAGLPVYRDNVGGIGTPTSDEERTKIELSTHNLLMIINGYSGKDNLVETGLKTVGFLKRYVSATNFQISLICKHFKDKLLLDKS